MPGWITIVEMMSRGTHYPQDLLQVFRTTLTAGDSVLLLKRSIYIASVTQHLSLAATVRKLLWPYVQHETQQAGKQILIHDLPNADQRVWYDEQLEKCKEVQMHRLVNTLLNAVITVDHQLKVCNTVCSISSCSKSSSDSSSNKTSSCSSSSTCSCFATQYSSSPAQLCTVTHTAENASPHATATTLERSDNTSAHKLLTTGYYLHQLQAVSGVMLIQMCLWLNEIEMTRCGTNYFPHESQKWIGRVLTSCRKLHNPHLQPVLIALLSEMSKPLSKDCPGASVTWERYAAAHFDGQLLPGCCNLRCTNLTGLSEQRLKTKCCGGCRRARYCTDECQRAAWLDGGHSTVCGVHT